MLKDLNSPELLSPVALSIALLPIMYGNLVAVFIKTVQLEECKGRTVVVMVMRHLIFQ